MGCLVKHLIFILFGTLGIWYILLYKWGWDYMLILCCWRTCMYNICNMYIETL